MPEDLLSNLNVLLQAGHMESGIAVYRVFRSEVDLRGVAAEEPVKHFSAAVLYRQEYWRFSICIPAVELCTDEIWITERLLKLS